MPSHLKAPELTSLVHFGRKARRQLTESQEFDQFVRESAGDPTRRTLVRGLAALLGAAGIGLPLADETEAAKKQNKRQQRRKATKRKDERKKKEKKRQEKR